MEMPLPRGLKQTVCGLEILLFSVLSPYVSISFVTLFCLSRNVFLFDFHFNNNNEVNMSNLGNRRVTLSSRRIRGLYDHLSPVYDHLTRFESGAEKRALKIASVKSGCIVLEVGFGTGRILLELAKRTGNQGKAYGIDVSTKMVEKTRRIIKKHKLSERVGLSLGDARNLPYRNEMFDLVFNSHMLDLIDTPLISDVLLEFKRVLKLGGRMVLVNLSKGNAWNSRIKVYEWVYGRWPSLLGGCRPILMKSAVENLRFERVGREFIMAGHIMPIEILWGDKGL